MLAYAPSYHYPHYHTPFYTPPAPLSPSTSPSSSPTFPLPMAVIDASQMMQETVVLTEVSKRTTKECSGMIAPSVGSHVGDVAFTRSGQPTVSSTWLKGVGGSGSGSGSGSGRVSGGSGSGSGRCGVHNVKNVSGVINGVSGVKNNVSGVINNMNGVKHSNYINMGVNDANHTKHMNNINTGMNNNNLHANTNGVNDGMSVNDVDEVKKLLDSYQYLVLKESMIIDRLTNCNNNNNNLSSSIDIKHLGHQLNSILIEKMKQLYTIVGRGEGEGEEHREKEDAIHCVERSMDISNSCKARKKSKIGVSEYDHQSNDTSAVKDISRQSVSSSTDLLASVSFSPPPTTPITPTNTGSSPSKATRGVMPAIVIDEQPSGNVVANKYLEPSIVVRVNSSYLSCAREGRLRITASLCLTFSDETIQRTLDNKQDILQGRTVVPVSTEGYATFNKLKIMEVSSKHHHHSFSISLQLQELKKVDDNHIMIVPLSEPIKSAPLHVQSRINKRKRSSSCSSSCVPDTTSTTTTPKKKSRRSRGSSSEADTNYVDITPLLVLPQKEAASRLGISESMLCKRFKECTKRKWPYRYLRKMDKMISVISKSNKKSNDPSNEEDIEKIQRLNREREECLQPVKIRITGHDKAGRRAGVSLPEVSDDTGKMSECSDSEMSSNSTSPCDEEDEEEIGSVKATTTAMAMAAAVGAVTGRRDRGRRERGAVEVVTATIVDEDVEAEEETGVEDEDEIAVVASTLNLLRQGGDVTRHASGTQRG